MKDKIKTVIVGFRASPKERQTIQMMAHQEGISFSEMCRVSIREAAIRRGIQFFGFINPGERDDNSDELRS
jgi:hypothetical protein